MSASVLAPAALALLLAACDAREETFATAADAAELVEKGWLPPLPASARAIRVAWDLDLSTAHFCGGVPWEDVRAAFPALEDAPAPGDPQAPGWWQEEVRSGTEAVRVRHGGGTWVLVRTAPASFCGATAAALG